MANKEREVVCPAKNLDHLNVLKPTLETIGGLKQKRWIKDSSPYWWQTDYSPDPREYMDFKEFRKRLVHLGICRTTDARPYHAEEYTREKDVYLYPKPEVPMTILNLEVLGQELPFLVTARPYHEKEKFDQPLSIPLLKDVGLEDLQELARSGGEIDLHRHFYPHVRGLFVEARGNNFFWYPLHVDVFWYEFGEKIHEALKKKHLGFVDLYEQPYMDGRTYVKVWKELMKRNDLVDIRPVLADFDYLEVSREEFIQGKDSNEDLLVYYPLRVSGIEETLPLVISNRTHKEGKERKPIVLGTYAENGGHGYTRRGGILRIKNLELAKEISGRISTDFGISVDTVLFTPQKGRPKYERISA